MAVTQIVGPRIAPYWADPVEWTSTRAYEPFTFVTYQGDSYCSRQDTPIGIDITNDDYWVKVSDYNAQAVALQRSMTHTIETAESNMESTIQAAENSMTQTIETAESNMESVIQAADNSMTQTIETAESNMESAIQAADNSMAEQVNAVQAIKNEFEAALNTTNVLKTTLQFNVLDYGAKGDGITDDTEAFKKTINAAVKSLTTGNIVYTAKPDKSWQATIVIPQGTYLLSDYLTIPATNNLVNSTDNRVCGINLLGIGMPVIDFNETNSGFVIEGCFFTCRNVQVQNGGVAFYFSGDKYTPYCIFYNCLIKKCANGILARHGFYMSMFVHVLGNNITNNFITTGSNTTSLVLVDCYCAGCDIAYRIGDSVYSTLISCCADAANVGFYLGDDKPQKDYAQTVLVGCGCEGISKYYILFSNSSHANYKVTGFNFNAPQSTVDELVHISGLSFSNITFEGTLFTNIKDKVKFCNSTTNNVVTVDSIQTDNVTLAEGLIKKSKPFFVYASIKANTPYQLAKIVTEANYFNLTLKFQIQNGIASNFYCWGEVTFVINKSDNLHFIYPVVHKAHDVMDPTFTYDIASGIISVSFPHDLSDTRCFIEQANFGPVFLNSI